MQTTKINFVKHMGKRNVKLRGVLNKKKNGKVYATLLQFLNDGEIQILKHRSIMM